MEILQLISIIAMKYNNQNFIYFIFFSIKIILTINNKIYEIIMQEDIKNVKKMGFKAFRMSISWPRVIPSKYFMEIFKPLNI